MNIPVDERLHLSEFQRTDTAALVTHLGDKHIYDRTLRIPYPYTEADAKAFLRIVDEAAERYGHPVHFAVRQDQQRLIGVLGFDGLIYEHRTDIGYWLARPYWGQGMMTNVVRAACQFAFERWNLVRITAHVFHFNRASARVLEKNGFELEGLLKKHVNKDGKFLDVKLYALLR